MLNKRSTDITQLKYLINLSFVANFLKNLPINVHNVILVNENRKARRTT